MLVVGNKVWLINASLLFAVLQEQYEFALAAVAHEVHYLLFPSAIR